MLRLILPILTVILFAVPLKAEPDAQVRALTDAMQLPALMEIMALEGQSYGVDLEAEMFPDRGAAPWADLIARIYDTERLESVMTEVLSAELMQDDLPDLLAFYGGELGARVTELEITARRALLDPKVEEASYAIWEEMLARDDPRLGVLDAFVQANDLIEMNVAGGLNSNLAFYRGLNDGGAFEYGLSEADMLNDVWSQEPDVRMETQDWLYPYLAMAYEPLSDEELQAYVDLSESDAGQRLNAALFAAFDVMFRQVSYDLGFGAAQFIKGQDI